MHDRVAITSMRISRCLGMLAQTVSPEDFFAPDGLDPIIQSRIC
jgi:hypothetical protein